MQSSKLSVRAAAVSNNRSLGAPGNQYDQSRDAFVGTATLVHFFGPAAATFDSKICF